MTLMMSKIRFEEWFMLPIMSTTPYMRSPTLVATSDAVRASRLASSAYAAFCCTLRQLGDQGGGMGFGNHSTTHLVGQRVPAALRRVIVGGALELCRKDRAFVGVADVGQIETTQLAVGKRPLPP